MEILMTLKQLFPLKILFSLSLIVNLTITEGLYAECVCFELEGQFGEEIKAVLKKYAKDKNINANSKVIEVDTNNADNTENTESFVGSQMFNSFSVESGATSDIQKGQKLYNRDCASCHGERAEKSVRTRPGIVNWDTEKIISELRSYQTRDYEGQSRFVKEQMTQRYRKQDIVDIANYIHSLKENKEKIVK